MCTYIMSQKVNDKTYTVTSQDDSNKSYDVQLCQKTCPSQLKCVPQCVQSGCTFLCRHMLTCTCLDYVHGHLCKHVHAVRMYISMSPESSNMESTTADDSDGVCSYYTFNLFVHLYDTYAYPMHRRSTYHSDLSREQWHVYDTLHT